MENKSLPDYLLLDKVTDCSQNRNILHLFQQIIAAFLTALKKLPAFRFTSFR